MSLEELFPFQTLRVGDASPRGGVGSENLGRVAGEFEADCAFAGAGGDDVEGRHTNLRQRVMDERLAAANFVEGDDIAPHAGALRAEGLVGGNAAERRE